MCEEENILERLKHDLKVDDDKAIILYEGLYGALSHYKNSIGLYIPSKPYATIKEATDSAYASLRQLNKALKEMDRETLTSLDSQYSAANTKSHDLINISLEELYWLDEKEKFQQLTPHSGFEMVAHRMEKTIERVMNDYNARGKGGARMEAKKNISAIHYLKCEFVRLYPDAKINNNIKQTSPFYKYVKIWYEYIIDSDLNDISRHIKNAINHSYFENEISGSDISN